MYLLFIGACSHCHCWKSMKGTGSIVRRSKGLVLYEFGPVKGFRQLCLPSSLWACFLLDPFNAISWSHLPRSWPPSPQSWRSCLCTQGAVVPKTFSPAALCTLIKLSTHHSSFPSQERSWQASSFPHCSIIGKGHTGKVSLTLSYASKLAFPPLQQSIWTSPLDTGTTEKKKTCLICLSQGPAGVCWIQLRGMRLVHRLLLVSQFAPKSILFPDAWMGSAPSEKLGIWCSSQRSQRGIFCFEWRENFRF